MTSVRSTSLIEALIVVVWSTMVVRVMPVGISACSCGRQLLDAVDGRDDVGAGLAVDDEQHGRFAVGKAGIADVGDRVADLRDVALPHGRAAVVGDDKRGVVDRLEELVVVLDGVGVLRVGEVALGQVGVGAGQCGAHLLEPNAVFVEARGGSAPRARRGSELPPTTDLPDALELREFLRQHGGGRVVHLALAVNGSEVSAMIMIGESAGLTLR